MENIDNPLLTAVKLCVAEQCARGLDELREVALLAWLRDQKLVPEEQLGPEGLYRVHFLMRNALYRLAHSDTLKQWSFSAVGVQWRPRANTGEHLPAPTEANLAQYYLNLSNLERSEAQVSELLAGFWRKFEAYVAADGDKLSAALSLLELDALSDLATLKRQYRRRAMALHPDRGGSDSALQALNQAYDLARARLT